MLTGGAYEIKRALYKEFGTDAFFAWLQFDSTPDLDVYLTGLRRISVSFDDAKDRILVGPSSEHHEGNRPSCSSSKHESHEIPIHWKQCRSSSCWQQGEGPICYKYGGPNHFSSECRSLSVKGSEYQ